VSSRLSEFFGVDCYPGRDGSARQVGAETCGAAMSFLLSARHRWAVYMAGRTPAGGHRRCAREGAVTLTSILRDGLPTESADRFAFPAG
jgi:hypothetical protein